MKSLAVYVGCNQGIISYSDSKLALVVSYSDCKSPILSYNTNNGDIYALCDNENLIRVEGGTSTAIFQSEPSC